MGLQGSPAGATLSRPKASDRGGRRTAPDLAYSESVDEATYDRIGVGYGAVRRTDPRIAARIIEALGDARSVLNVGAGTGSYEPADRQVTAVEPSAEMIGQRPPGLASVVQASAEELPFEDGSFDAAMAIITDHHWRDRAAGLREMLRVARHRVLLLNADPALAQRFWLTRDYLPGFISLIPERYRRSGYWEQELQGLLGEVEVQPVPVPYDCQDAFYQAYWRRPRAYLDGRVREGISVFHRLPQVEVAAAMKRLSRDLDDGTWEERYGHLCEKPELDIGLRLVVAEAG
jgi:SAM-dependent methyltransferase